MSRLRQGVRAFGWSIAGELGARVLGPLAFIVLARILRPEDFGVVAAATVMISLAQVLADLGLGKALVQRDAADEATLARLAGTTLRLTAAAGVLLTLLLLAGAPAVARFFDDARVAPALQALAPVLLLGGLAATPLALLQRALRFRALFAVRVAGGALPPLLSVPLALALPEGQGWWALVAGTLLGALVQVVAAWALLGAAARAQALRGGFDADTARGLAGFGRWALLSALFGWGYGWLDAVVVGRMLGAHEMGLYRTGHTLVTLVFGLLFTPLLPVLYSLFSRAQHEPALLRDSLNTVVQLAAMLLLPLALALFLLRDVLAAGVLGPQWAAAGSVIGVLALAQGAAWLVAFNGEVYRAMGRPAVEAWVMGPMLAVYAVGYVVAAAQGLEAFLWARLALTWLGIAVQVLVAMRVLGLPLRDTAPPLAAAAAVTALALGLVSQPPWLQALAWLAVALAALAWQGRRLLALVRRWHGARHAAPVAEPGA